MLFVEPGRVVCLIFVLFVDPAAGTDDTVDETQNAGGGFYVIDTGCGGQGHPHPHPQPQPPPQPLVPVQPFVPELNRIITPPPYTTLSSPPPFLPHVRQLSTSQPPAPSPPPTPFRPQTTSATPQKPDASWPITVEDKVTQIYVRQCTDLFSVNNGCAAYDQSRRLCEFASAYCDNTEANRKYRNYWTQAIRICGQYCASRKLPVCRNCTHPPPATKAPPAVNVRVINPWYSPFP